MKYTIDNFARLIDHTNLHADASNMDMKKLCDEAKKYHFKMVAINQVQAKFCSEQLKGTDIDTGAAIAFPLGQQTIASKIFDTEDAIKKLAEIAKEVKPDFIKTSTGFGPSGAKVEDVKLMKSIVGEDVKVKAAGGIKNSDDFLAMIRAGADRIGCSAGVKIIEALKQRMQDDNVTTIEINR